MLLQTIKIICIVCMVLLAAKILWVIGISEAFAKLPQRFLYLKQQLPKGSLRDPFGRRFHTLLHWHVLHSNLSWGRIVYLLGRARLHKQVKEALTEVYLGADENYLPYVAVYERLVYRGTCYYAPLLARLFLKWYTRKPGRLFLAMESYQEVRRQEKARDRRH